MNPFTILVTNDDGITAKGIACLIEVAKKFGRVVVVAPDKPQSAMGHAITISQPLRLTKVDIFEGIEAYACSGTPVDCVKLAVDKVLHQHPDLCLSGINHGSNSSINVIYSGTMSAAMEASLEGIMAVGFSLCDYSSNANFTASAYYIELILEQILKKGMPACKLLNVNIPNLSLSEIKGLKLCRQARAKWVENFTQRIDPVGRPYYWLTGEFINLDHGNDTDEHALENGYVSIVPIQCDLTSYADLKELNDLWN